MALQGPDSAAAARLQADDDDDFAGFSDSSNYSDDDVSPPIAEASYNTFRPTDTVELLQAEFNR
jgi:hypothetical protein